MANWLVSGAGTAAYNGSYVEDGVESGKPAYRLDASHWLSWYALGSQWVLGSGGADVQYFGAGADLPANPWSVGLGTAPAPTVTAEEVPPEGGGDVGAVLEITTPLGDETVFPGPLLVWGTIALSNLSPDGWGNVDKILWVTLHYEDGSYGSFESREFHKYVPIIGGETKTYFKVLVNVLAGHTSFTLRVQGQGVVYVSYPGMGSWWGGSDTESPINIRGSAPGAAPAVVIATPANGATVGGDAESVRMEASDTEGLVSIALAVDGVNVGTQLVSGLNAAWTYPWNTLFAVDGLHYLTATATDTDGLTDTDTIVVTVANGTPGEDTTDPTVQITAPAGGATASGATSITALCADDQALASARVLVDGNQAGDPVTLIGKHAEANFSVDFGLWGNGSHTITVLCLDAADNEGEDSITVTVNNLLADVEKVFWSEEDPVRPDLLAAGLYPRCYKLDVTTGLVPTDPRLTFNVYPFWQTRLAGDPALTGNDYSTYKPVSQWQIAPCPDLTVASRFCLVARPTFRSSYWEKACNDFFRITDCGGRILVTARTPNQVYELQVPNLDLLWDLSTGDLTVTTINEVAYLDGKLYLGTDQGVLACDLDSGQEPVLLRLVSSGYDTTQIAASDDTLYFAQGGKLYSFTYPVPTILTDTYPDDLLAWYGGLLLATDFVEYSGEGHLYAWAPGVGDSYGANWLLLATTDTRITRVQDVALAGATPAVDLWLGAELAVWRTLPAVAQDGTFLAGEALAVAPWRGTNWLGGTVGGLWWRTSAGWAQYDVLTGVTSIEDMRVIDDRLYLACEWDDGDDHTARLYALRVDVGTGDFQCGPNPPDAWMVPLEHAAAEVVT